uniref:Uncharacterized protein n=1 Tax=Arundo donax TaxID=35708 RepID=A0A0A9GBW4_ARUDO
MSVYLEIVELPRGFIWRNMCCVKYTSFLSNASFDEDEQRVF